MLEELKSFYSLFTWTSVFLALLVISFNKFLLLFSTLSFSCILLYTWVAHCAFNDILIIYIYIYIRYRWLLLSVGVELGQS